MQSGSPSPNKKNSKGKSTNGSKPPPNGNITASTTPTTTTTANTPSNRGYSPADKSAATAFSPNVSAEPFTPSFILQRQQKESTESQQQQLGGLQYGRQGGGLNNSGARFSPPSSYGGVEAAYGNGMNTSGRTTPQVSPHYGANASIGYGSVNNSGAGPSSLLGRSSAQSSVNGGANRFHNNTNGATTSNTNNNGRNSFDEMSDYFGTPSRGNTPSQHFRTSSFQGTIESATLHLPPAQASYPSAFMNGGGGSPSPSGIGVSIGSSTSHMVSDRLSTPPPGGSSASVAANSNNSTSAAILLFATNSWANGQHDTAEKAIRRILWDSNVPNGEFDLGICSVSDANQGMFGSGGGALAPLVGSPPPVTAHLSKAAAPFHSQMHHAHMALAASANNAMSPAATLFARMAAASYIYHTNLQNGVSGASLTGGDAFSGTSAQLAIGYNPQQAGDLLPSPNGIVPHGQKIPNAAPVVTHYVPLQTFVTNQIQSTSNFASPPLSAVQVAAAMPPTALNRIQIIRYRGVPVWERARRVDFLASLLEHAAASTYPYGMVPGIGAGSMLGVRSSSNNVPNTGTPPTHTLLTANKGPWTQRFPDAPHALGGTTPTSLTPTNTPNLGPSGTPYGRSYLVDLFKAAGQAVGVISPHGGGGFGYAQSHHEVLTFAQKRTREAAQPPTQPPTPPSSSTPRAHGGLPSPIGEEEGSAGTHATKGESSTIPTPAKPPATNAWAKALHLKAPSAPLPPCSTVDAAQEEQPTSKRGSDLATAPSEDYADPKAEDAEDCDTATKAAEVPPSIPVPPTHLSTVRVASFNILFELYDDPKTQYYAVERIPLIIKAIEDTDADIIGLQEVTQFLFGQIREGSALLREQYHWTVLPATINDGKDKNLFNQIILSRFPIIDAAYLKLDRYKRCLFVVLLNHTSPTAKSNPDDNMFIVANTHLKSDYGTNSGGNSSVRANELKSIFHMLSAPPPLMSPFSTGGMAAASGAPSGNGTNTGMASPSTFYGGTVGGGAIGGGSPLSAFASQHQHGEGGGGFPSQRRGSQQNSYAATSLPSPSAPKPIGFESSLSSVSGSNHIPIPIAASTALFNSGATDEGQPHRTERDASPISSASTTAPATTSPSPMRGGEPNSRTGLPPIGPSAAYLGLPPLTVSHSAHSASSVSSAIDVATRLLNAQPPYESLALSRLPAILLGDFNQNEDETHQHMCNGAWDPAFADVHLATRHEADRKIGKVEATYVSGSGNFLVCPIVPPLRCDRITVRGFDPHETDCGFSLFANKAVRMWVLGSANPSLDMHYVLDKRLGNGLEDESISPEIMTGAATPTNGGTDMHQNLMKRQGTAAHHDPLLPPPLSPKLSPTLATAPTPSFGPSPGGSLSGVLKPSAFASNSGLEGDIVSASSNSKNALLPSPQLISTNASLLPSASGALAEAETQWLVDMYPSDHFGVVCNVQWPSGWRAKQEAALLLPKSVKAASASPGLSSATGPSTPRQQKQGPAVAVLPQPWPKR